MTPTWTISAPAHPWAKVAVPVAAVALGGLALYAGTRVTDSDRSTTDRVLSGVVGAGALAGAAALGFKLGVHGAGIGDEAMKAVREGGSYATYAWPKGTAEVTRGAGTWWITPHEAIGDALVTGALGGGFFGAAGGLGLGTYLDGRQHAK